MTVIDDHLTRFDDAQRVALIATATTIRAALPGATEVLSYGMPTFKVGGDTGIAVVGFDGFVAHNSLFPYSGQINVDFANELSGYVQTKGSIHFDRTRRFPPTLLKRILKARIREINASFPKRSGESREFYDNGALKASGKVRAGELHGPWQWYRKDGTMLRSGSFRAGEQIGEWTTYDRTGAPYKVTRFA